MNNGRGDVVDPTLARLRAYQEARALSDAVSASVAPFPLHERFALADQMRRAASSVYANIAEGHGRPTRADKARCSSMAWSSLSELRAHVEHAAASHLLTADASRDLATRALRVSRLLSGLRRSVTP